MEEVLRIDLKFSVPDNVGMCFSGRDKMRTYSNEDVPALLACFDQLISEEKLRRKTDSVKVYLKGMSSDIVLMMLAAGIRGRADVKEMWFEKPHNLPCKIFSN